MQFKPFLVFLTLIAGIEKPKEKYNKNTKTAQMSTINYSATIDRQ